MNQSALEGFVKIVEMDSFSAAAEALYLSQSALSQQIRTLEGHSCNLNCFSMCRVG